MADRKRDSFFIRIKQNQCVINQHKQPLSHLFRDFVVGQKRYLRKPRLVGQTDVYLSGLRLETGELLIVASNIACATPMDVYALRWQIEHLFQCLKGRGFHFEEMHLTHYFRIKKMMALLAIALAWAHKVGEWQHKVIKPLVIKNTAV
ncbi:MAG: transposase [Moraxellaceae bacterium]|nr:transposase [Moraxellaceae bacterium]